MQKRDSRETAAFVDVVGGRNGLRSNVSADRHALVAASDPEIYDSNCCVHWAAGLRIFGVPGARSLLAVPCLPAEAASNRVADSLARIQDAVKDAGLPASVVEEAVREVRFC